MSIGRRHDSKIALGLNVMTLKNALLTTVFVCEQSDLSCSGLPSKQESKRVVRMLLSDLLVGQA